MKWVEVQLTLPINCLFKYLLNSFLRYTKFFYDHIDDIFCNKHYSPLIPGGNKKAIYT